MAKIKMIKGAYSLKVGIKGEVDMIIREIHEDDAEKFLSMLKKLDLETKYMMYEPEERKTTIDEMKASIRSKTHSKSLIMIAEISEEIIGFISAERGFQNRIKHSAYIVIGILSNYRGKGIGRQFFNHLEKWTTEMKISRLELTVMVHNERAVKLYESKGFKIEGRKEKSLMIDGEFIDEYYMARLL